MLRVGKGGALSFLDGASDGKFTANGNFEGGGTLQFDIDVVKGEADTLFVAGDVTGDQTVIDLTIISSPASTASTIDLVEVGGSVDEDAFAPAGGAFEVGAYTYGLGFDENVFFLDLEAQLGLNSRGELYELSAAALLLGFTDVPSLNDRLRASQSGGTETLSTRGAPGADLGPGRQSWARVFGSQVETDFASGFDGNSLDSSAFGIQAGHRIAEFTLGEGGVFVDLTLRATDVTTHVLGETETGTVASQGLGLGATATWLGESGTYVDAQTEFTFIRSDFSTSDQGVLAEQVDSTARSLSVEVGHRFDLSPSNAIIPQAQFSYGRISSDSFTDSLGNLVEMGSDTSVVGRVGVRYEYSANGFEGFVAGSLSNDFSDNQLVAINGEDFGINPDVSWAEIELGGTAALSDLAQVFFSGSYLNGISGGDDRSATSLSAGVSFLW